MKSEEVDDIAADLLYGMDNRLSRESKDHFKQNLNRLATALKSALADTERIDWLEENCRHQSRAETYDTIRIQISPQGKPLRETIDERRKA